MVSDTERASVARLLANLGYEVFGADCVDSGLQEFQTGQYSLVLLETVQDVDASLVLVEQFREQQADVACVVIAKRQASDSDNVPRHEGIRRCLHSPVNSYELIDTIESVLSCDSLTFHRQLGESQECDLDGTPGGGVGVDH